MTRQLEQADEERTRKQSLALWRALDGGIDSSLQADGYELVGLSLKVSGGDCLCTVRVSNHEGAFVAFVGGENIAKTLTKLHRESRGGMLRYRQDRYVG